MKYLVKIQGKEFQVEIENLHTRPVIAFVEGEPVEVWVERTPRSVPVNATPYSRTPGEGPRSEPRGKTKARSDTARTGPSKMGDGKSVLSPIPGVILSVSVNVGDDVTIGQELCILEAMKMKNAVRSNRFGVIAKVLVSPGQTVQHHDPLIEFAD